ncbi:MAG TPA: M23 family metallopeptidase [Acidimicrobiales bacterium]|nr:M23 family metallopeptidase [Acidimicrobiales bacterium]
MLRVSTPVRIPRWLSIAAVVAAIALVGAFGSEGTGRYTVRKGDTLAGIARTQRSTVSAIAAANGIGNPNYIRAGQVLSIPGSGGSGGGGSSSAPSGAQKTFNGTGIVIVRRGETLSQVAARAGVSSWTIAKANGLTRPYNLYVGGQLLLSDRNGASTSPLVRCPVRATFMNDWGFPRSDTGFHQGTDMLAPKGTPIVAPASGTVTQGTGSIGGRYFRLIAKDGTMYYGAHMSKFGKAGRVKAGDILGYVGNTGDAAGGATHLHFEIHPVGGSAVNPYPYLVRACK